MKIAHPLWSCGLRPFFLFASVSAVLLMTAWGLFLVVGFPLPAVAGGPFVWHAHELLFGFALAAMTGFLLTVVPEFAGGGDYPAVPVRRLALLWLLGRLAFWSSGLFGTAALVVSALAHLALLGGLAWLAAPRLWRDPERKHLAFLWALLGFAVCVGGFYIDALRDMPAAHWLHAALGMFMMLIIVALSRISMRIVNHELQQTGELGTEYRARPPRRNLAIVCIGVYTAADFLLPGTRLVGWLALAAAAGVFNLMNDWHIGRVLFRRLPLMLYGVYVLMAAGYTVMGLALILDNGLFSAGRHLLTVGALGLAIFAVMTIAGRAHCGTPFETRLWQPLAAWLLVAAALVRAANWLDLAALLWTSAWLLFVIHMVPLFWRARADGRFGCKGTAIP
ncbi:NnrS family protein [Rhodocyclaceae bacterium]